MENMTLIVSNVDSTLLR